MLPGRVFLLILLLGPTVVSALATPALPAVYFVRQSGSDSNNGLSKEYAFRTVQKAIQTASGDSTIYIGAGEYSEAIYGNFNSTTTGNFALIGDTSGDQTGDAGEVILRALNDHWAVRLYRLTSLEIANLTFIADGDPETSQGCYVYGTVGGTIVKNCKFQDLRYGVYAHTCTTSSIHGCQFENISVRATVGYRGDEHSVSNCTFSECHYAVHSNQIPKCTVSSSAFRTEPDEDEALRLNYAIQAYSTDLTVADCEMLNPHVAIGTNYLSSATIQNVTVTKPRSWAVSLIGTALAAENVEIAGPESERSGYGLRMHDTLDGTPKIKDCSCTNLHIAFYAENNRYEFEQLTLENNTYGLFVEKKAEDFRLHGDDGITIANNYAGIRSRHTEDEPGQITLDGVTITDNDFGLLSYDSSVSVENSTFEANGIGVRCDRAPIAEFKNSQFVANTERTSWHHYGLQLSSDSCTIEDCSFTENTTGVRLVNLSDEAPKLNNLTFTDNSRAALDVIYGNLKLDDGSNISIAGGEYGLILNQTECELSKLNLPIGQLRPISIYQGKLTLEDMQLEQGYIGIHANTSELTVARCNFDSFSHSGVYAWNCPPITIEDCHFESNGSYAVRLDRPHGLTLQNCDLLKSTSYGLLVNGLEGQDCEVLLSNNTFAENRYGFRGIRVAFDSAKSKGNTFRTNVHGLRIEHNSLTLASENDNQMIDNTYAILNYHGQLNVDGLTSSGNTNMLYSYMSDTKITNCNLQPTGYGLISYSGRTEVDEFSVTGSQYGIYLSPRANASNEIKLSNLTFANLSNNGVHIHKHDINTPIVSIEDMTVSGCRHGIYSNNGDVEIERCSVNGATSYAVYQVSGESEFRNLQIANADSWGIVCQGGELELNNCSVESRHGVYLNSDSALLVNNVIKGSTYGVYTRNEDGNYQVLQSTIGGITHYGILHNAGNITLRNSIVEAARFALWNRAQSGEFVHDHNLVKSERNYVNETPGLNEIEKDPIFVDPASGDLHLAAGSPAINAGTDLSSLTVTDYDGNARPAFRKFEIGAFEFTSEQGSLRILDWDEKAQ